MIGNPLTQKMLASKVDQLAKPQRFDCRVGTNQVETKTLSNNLKKYKEFLLLEGFFSKLQKVSLKFYRKIQIYQAPTVCEKLFSCIFCI